MSLMEIQGRVQIGRKQGKKLGFPTINISVPRFVKKNDWGVYLSEIIIEDEVYHALTNLGPPKTFRLSRARCESYILDASKDWYGKKVSIKFLSKLRNIKKFGSVDELKKQIQKDVNSAKIFFKL